MVYFGLNFAGYYSNVFSSSYLFKFKTKSSKSVDGKKFNDVHNIKVLRHQQLDRPSQRSPCIDEVRETMHQCLKRYFAQKMGCRLPWYHQSPNPDLPVCTRIQDTLLYLNLTAKIRPMDRHDLVTELDCDMPCSYYEYQMEIHHEKMVDCEGNCQQTHTLILPDGNVYVDKEVLLYDGNNFIADSGGYLGLLLGASVITLYEWLEKVARKGWRRYFERKNGDLSGARKMDTK